MRTLAALVNGRTLRGAAGASSGARPASSPGLWFLPLVAALVGLADRTTPAVLRITRFGLVVGLAITAWSGARQVGAWLTQARHG